MMATLSCSEGGGAMAAPPPVDERDEELGLEEIIAINYLISIQF